MLSYNYSCFGHFIHLPFFSLDLSVIPDKNKVKSKPVITDFIGEAHYGAIMAPDSDKHSFSNAERDDKYLTCLQLNHLTYAGAKYMVKYNQWEEA